MMSRPTVVGIGEILWDVFPDGPRFGGAPANFACSAAELARDRIDVYTAGGVGADDLGGRAIEALHAHGVDTSCVAMVDCPTGQVLVELDAAGGASYAFAANAAWDDFAWSEELQKLAARADAVCFSTLGQRSGLSRQTVQRFLRATPAKCLRVLDINLRPPFWNEAVVLQSLQLANVLKVNDAELSVLADVLGSCAARIMNYCSSSWTGFHFKWWLLLGAVPARYCSANLGRAAICRGNQRSWRTPSAPAIHSRQLWWSGC